MGNLSPRHALVLCETCTVEEPELALSEHGDSPACSSRNPGVSDSNRIVHTAIKNAKRLTREHRWLDAEFVYAQAIARLQALGDKDALSNLAMDENYTAMANHLAQYESAGAMMDELSGRGSPSLRGVQADCGPFELVWDGDDSRLWVCAPSGATWFKTRLALRIDAPLHLCALAIGEADLQPRWQSTLAQVPENLVPRSRLHSVVHMIQNILMFSVEVVFEVTRYFNKDYGSMVEIVTSNFPKEDIQMPEFGWFSQVADVDTTNVWLPQGGIAQGTLMVQQARVDLGIPIPDFVLRWVVETAAQQTVQNFRHAVALASSVSDDNPWRPRLLQDATGLYAELREIEVAAEQREELDVGRLPGLEVTERRHLLPVQQEGVHKFRATPVVTS